MISTPGRILVGPRDGESVRFRGLGARFMLAGADTAGGFSLVEHPIQPRTLAAPLHVHEREDEYSYVLEGELGVQVGDEIVYATPGDLVLKPRGIWHAFWNRSEQPARLLELICPPGFERYFAEIAPLLPPNRPAPDFLALAEVQARYRLQVDLSSVETICRREGLPLPPA